ncbi:hypothetical protein [Pseudotabrizicola sp. 4114]|uniref:hypothetical protein n=1 Tax=Pseudotabrizicola sp. 4114 TaxID=2817731 RepID=UPI002864C4D5|nr:hypothetical protein [Pseudorhodobacter sp. 4114]
MTKLQNITNVLALRELSLEEREYKAYKLREVRTLLSAKIKALENVAVEPTLPLAAPTTPNAVK